ncbi:helix-turn-helix domain-containing protein [Micromonospora aurantiaca (nom. illeg.)]|uniref:helix-turn-helix domain-containing protein n=1 Tax=Micromonospora aurantiaca (nom. illeg.) TaxID=47850 RepID=UPI00341E4604
METGTRERLRHQVAEEIRAQLGRKQMSGAKLARAIDQSEMYVSRRLRGETAFDLDDLERIADVLGVTVTDLMPSAKVRPNNR